MRPTHVVARRDPITGLDDEAVLEREDDVVQVVDRHLPTERREHRLRDEALDDPLFGGLVADGLELDLADGRGDDGAEIRDSWRTDGLAQADRPPERCRLEHLRVRHRDPDADAGALADLRRPAGEMGQLRQQLVDERRHDDGRLALAGLESLLLLVDDRELVIERPRIVGPDLRPEPILDRRDDPAATRVVLRVGRRDDEQIERQPDGETPDLDVALLEDVEQSHLDPFGEVRQLVDREDAAVRPRDEPVVERQFVTEITALCDANRVDLADQIGDRDVGCRQLLGIAPVAWQPVDRRLVAVLVDGGLGGRADRGEGIVVQLAAANDR